MSPLSDGAIAHGFILIKLRRIRCVLVSFSSGLLKFRRVEYIKDAFAIELIKRPSRLKRGSYASYSNIKVSLRREKNRRISSQRRPHTILINRDPLSRASKHCLEFSLLQKYLADLALDDFITVGERKRERERQRERGRKEERDRT